MPTNTILLDQARKFLVETLKGKTNPRETIHPWRKDWEFAALHSSHVEAYVLKILDRQPHHLDEHEILMLRMAAILHDIARLDVREAHAQAGAEIASQWLCANPNGLSIEDIARIVGLIAVHSNKGQPEGDFSKAVLKDADTLDEIGVMSVFMTGNWLERGSPFFFHDLRQRLAAFELPFCDQQMAILNTEGARQILLEKRAFIELLIAQLDDELVGDAETVIRLRELR